jgi:ComEC/Rec2-related protein
MGTIKVMEVGATSPAGPVSGLANMLRRTLAAGAETLGPEASALLSGLVVGDDRSQSDRTADDFRAAGLGHLLAVSGQNVAFVLAAAGPLLHRLRFRYRLPLALLLLGFFALVTRFEPSVLRATVMAGGSALAAARGRSLGGLRLLAMSVVALLVVDPLLVHRAAFQLSVAASAGILLASRSLAAAVPGPALVRETAGVTLAAQAAVAPILLASFGPMPVAAIPANLMAAPVAGPLMIWGITGGLLAGLLGPPFDWILHLPSAIGLWWIAEVARLAGRWSLGLFGTTAGIAVSLAVATVAVLSDRGSTVVARRLLAALLIALASISIMTVMSTPGAGIRDGIRLLDDSGAVVVVDRRYSAERLLESLRVRGVRSPSLIVFREPVTPGLSGAVVERYGAVRIVGPPGSVDAEVPMDSTVVHVAGQAWLLDIGNGTLSMRRLGP